MRVHSMTHANVRAVKQEGVCGSKKENRSRAKDAPQGSIRANPMPRQPCATPAAKENSLAKHGPANAPSVSKEKCNQRKSPMRTVAHSATLDLSSSRQIRRVPSAPAASTSSWTAMPVPHVNHAGRARNLKTRRASALHVPKAAFKSNPDPRRQGSSNAKSVELDSTQSLPPRRLVWLAQVEGIKTSRGPRSA